MDEPITVRFILAVPTGEASEDPIPQVTQKSIDGASVTQTLLEKSDPGVPEGLNFDPVSGALLLALGVKIVAASKAIATAVATNLIAQKVQSIAKRRAESEPKKKGAFEIQIAFPDGKLMAIRSDRPLAPAELERLVESSGIQ